MRRLASGKLPAALLARVLARFPPAPPEVRLGPRPGEDACALELPGGTLVAATDPITLADAQTGRLAVLVNANDLAVTGARPRWFLAVVLLPAGTEESAVEALFEELRRALDEVGASLVGGHTEVTPIVAQPVVVGQMLGLAEDGRFLATAGARPGDAIVQVGPAPVEGAAVLARAAGARLAGLDPALLAAAGAALERPGISIVEPALLAARLGATALHDATEGGLAAALHELADASGVALAVDREAVLWFEPGVALCRALGVDPWATLSSGTLLAAFPPEAAARAVGALTAAGRPAALVGTASSGSGVRDGGGRPIPWPQRDEVHRALAGGAGSATAPSG